MYVLVLKLEVYNAVSSPRIMTMANQVLTINVTENVSVDVKNVFVLFSGVLSSVIRLCFDNITAAHQQDGF